MKTTKMMAIVAVLAFGMMFGGAAQAGLINAYMATPTNQNTSAWAQIGFGLWSAAPGRDVNRLGVWVPGGTLTSNSVVSLYRYTGSAWIAEVSATVLAGTTVDTSQYAWASTTTTHTLSASTWYALMEQSGGGVCWSNNACAVADSTFGGAPGNGYYTSSAYPATNFTYDDAFHAGPNMGYEASSAVPEPAGLGLVGLALLAIRRRQV